MKLTPIFGLTILALLHTTISASAHQGGKAEEGAHSQKGNAPGYHRKFNDAKHWVKVFDDPERDKWQLPSQVVETLGVKPNDVIADIGAGTGYFSFRIARAMPQSKVYAADVEKDMLTFLADEAKRQQCTNVLPYEIKTAKPELPEDVNLALIVDTFHHIDNRVEYFKDLQSSLKPDGRIVIIDFTDESPVGPPKDHRIDKKEVIAELKEAGYKLSSDKKFLPYQYFLEFRKEKEKGQQ
ncbi:MAG TPA: class I SAM-dependent methyltransferase [Candidatus Melainabacteria bacterium]|nr:class I SAM-dependent methyltransferase [Candidatus Melainabacteria bacterium]